VADGMVGRETKGASPPQVTYSLTRAGRELGIWEFLPIRKSFPKPQNGHFGPN
jgi:hypothetical protein